MTRQTYSAKSDHEAMIVFFRLVALNREALSDWQLAPRDFLVGRYPDAWAQAQRLGPFHLSEPDFCPGVSMPVTIH